MEYEQSDLLKWLRNRAILEESDATTWQLNHAAGTIERLQKERDEGWANALRVQAERDAALAEVERLKGELNDRSDEMKTRRSEAFFSGYVASKQVR